MIVCAEACDLVLSSSRDGVHKVWDGESVSFRRGSRLALGEVIRLESSILQLLSLHEMPELNVNGGVKMYRRGGAKVSHGLGGSLSL